MPTWASRPPRQTAGRPVDERSGEKTAADAREDHPATRLAEIVAAELRAKTAACMRVTPDTRAPASG